jgi:hypothetical protein
MALSLLNRPVDMGVTGNHQRSAGGAPGEFKLPSLNLNRPAAGGEFQEIGPQGDNRALVDDLSGGIRSRNDAAANQAIGNISRRTGGDQSSPAFQFLSTMATTGAAGRTGSEVASLKFDAAEAGAQRELQRNMSNQSARLEAQRIADQFALSGAGLSLQLGNLALGQQGEERLRAQTVLGIDNYTPATSGIAKTLGHDIPGQNYVGFGGSNTRDASGDSRISWA